MQMERAELQFAEFERELQREFLRTYPYPGFELGASHFSDLGLAHQRAVNHPIIGHSELESGIVLPD
jgi:hypothetical protein